MSKIFASVETPPSVRTVTGALARAAAAARYAPSIHNTQPWHWRVGDAGLDLYLDHDRQLGSTDPDGRLAILSCGAALHHACTALTATGWQVEVTGLPDPTDPDHLAHLSLYDRRPVTAGALRRVRAVRERHTDRRPVTADMIDGGRLLAITVAVEGEGAWLHVLPRDRVIELGSALSYAQRTETADPAWQAEVSAWTGGTRPEGAGVPDAAIPDRPTRTTVPGRDFGHPGELSTGTGHDLAATFAILYGERDAPVDWLRAGQALSAAWLTATELGVTLLPLSAAVEVPATRPVLRRLLSGPGQPYLVLRLGIADPAAGPLHTPRLPAGQTVERIPE
jgi:nitroreductase